MKETTGSYNWQSISKMLLEHRSGLIRANLVAILGALAAIPVPLLIPLLVDEVLLNQPGTSIQIINSIFPQNWHGPLLYILSVLFLTLLLRLIALVFGVWQTREFTHIAKNVIYHLRKRMLLHLQRVSMSEFETLGSGTVASHLVTDLQTIDDFISISISKVVVAVLVLAGTAVVLLWLHLQLALFILLLNPLVIYVTTIFGRKVKTLKKKENSAFQLFQEALSESLNAIQQIRAANREEHYIKRLINRAANVQTHSSSFAWKSDAASRLSFVVFLFGFDIFRALSMIMVLYSGLSIGEMLAVYAYLWFMMGPVQEVLSIQYAWHGANGALARIRELMQIKQEPIYPHRKNPFAHTETVSIQLKNISFAYGNGPDVLHDLNLNIAKGSKVALVGASGGGKTTFAQLLIGLYVPKTGEVLYDKIPVKDIGLDVVRDNIATVLQHPVMLNDTVRVNLTLGKEIADFELWKALEIAQLKEIVEKLPQRLETMVGNNGIRLSGGQKQRLAVARMLLSNAKVIILDEATSALDTVTESALHSALEGFLANRTTIIIAHRLSAVKRADRVLVFEDGHIIEDGEHEHLIKNKGLYAALYQKSSGTG